MNSEELQVIQTRINYWFNNPDLLQQAFIRRSYSQEHGGGDNEVLEFIGDKALDFVIVKLLSEEYGDYAENYDDYDPDEDCNEYISDCRENKLTEMKRILVEGKTLAKRIDMLDFSQYLILGKGDRKNRIYNNASVKEDLFEAIIGAVALDSDWNIKTLEEVVDRMLDPYSYISDDLEDQYISIVQNWSNENYGRYPDFICEENKYYSLYVSSLTVKAKREEVRRKKHIITLKITNCLQQSKTKSKNQAKQWRSISLKHLRGEIILICQNINTPKPTIKTAIRNGR